jgi:hypothetical protein
MATGGAGVYTNPQPIPQVQPSHRGAPGPISPASTGAASPPSKRELASWWKLFRKTNEKTDEKGTALIVRRPQSHKLTTPVTVEPAQGIFGVPLAESIRYANVAISLTDDQGDNFIYGYVPIVVAKCGVFLKEKGNLFAHHAVIFPLTHLQQPTWKVSSVSVALQSA